MSVNDAPADPGDEPVEWVDRRGQVIEVVTRRRMRSENLCHRSVGIVVMSSTGQLLVHRRAETKDLFPGWWDICVGGVVGVQEPYADAAKRELAEEIGLTQIELEWLGKADWHDDNAHEIGQLYRAVSDGPFEFADGEVVEARFVSKDEFTQFAAVRQFIPGSLVMLLPYLDGFEL